MAVEDKQNNKMPKQSSFFIAKCSTVHRQYQKHVLYNFVPPACYFLIYVYPHMLKILILNFLL